MSRQAEQAAGDEEEDEDDIADDAIAEVDDDIFNDYAKNGDVGDTSLDQSSYQILTSVTDPIAWKTELERVGPRLRSQQQLASNEWRSHVDLTVKNKDQINENLPGTKDDLNMIGRYESFT